MCIAGLRPVILAFVTTSFLGDVPSKSGSLTSPKRILILAVFHPLELYYAEASSLFDFAYLLTVSTSGRIVYCTAKESKYN